MAETNTNHDDLDALYEQVMTCEPAINPVEVEELADAVRSNSLLGMPWRLTAVIAGKDGSFFKALSEDEGQAKAIAPSIDLLNEFAARLRGMAELAECVAARMMAAGCNHEQFIDWMTAESAEAA